MNKQILIIGSTGFIGSYLTNYFIKENVNLTTFSKSKYINKNVRHICGFIEDKKNYKKLLINKPDVIYLLSGISGQINTEKKDTQSWLINVTANINFLNAVLKYSPNTRLIISGSRLEYGKPLYLPVNEKHPLQPLGLYGYQKNVISSYAQYLYRKYKLDIVMLRTSNPYGVWNKNKGGYNFISNLINRAILDKELYIYGTGKQKRDYLYIDDFIGLLVKLVNNKKAKGQIYNVGSGKGTSLIEVIKYITKITEKGRIKYLSWPPEEKKLETGDYVSDISKVSKDLNWKPKTSIYKGIKITIEKSL